MSVKNLEELIKERAYLLAEAKGGNVDPFLNWLQAEKEVKAELKKKEKEPVKPAAAKPAAVKQAAAPKVAAPKVEAAPKKSVAPPKVAAVPAKKTVKKK